MNYELSGNELKFNWKLINNELKLNKNLNTWMNIQMNEFCGIGIYDITYPSNNEFHEEQIWVFRYHQ
jgi:hypothetical protein